MANYARDALEMDELMSFASAPIKTKKLTRWQRKALQKQQRNGQCNDKSILSLSSANANCSVSYSSSCTPSCGGIKTPSRKRQAPSGTPMSRRKSKKKLRANTGTEKSDSAVKGDRFIPNRAAMNLEVCQFRLTLDEATNGVTTATNAKLRKESTNDVGSNATNHTAVNGDGNASSSDANHINNTVGCDDENSIMKSDFQETLKKTMIRDNGNARVLALSSKAPAPPEEHINSLKVLYSQNSSMSTHRRKVNKVTRHIPSAPERILDAPDLMDDYYLNLIDWSCVNIIAVALGQSVYLWNAATGAIDELLTLEHEDDYVSSVSWVKEGGSYLAVGTNHCDVALWDVEASRQLRSMKGHEARVGALDWNKHILSSGSRDSTIINHDVRVAKHHISTFVGHEQEVCGLKWSPDGETLATGGNDNQLMLWDLRGGQGSSTSMNGSHAPTIAPRCRLNEHVAAVKALAWCPFQRNVLASGGGTADRCIKFWNGSTGKCLNSIDTGSQVCSLVWSKSEKELLSSHGFSKNQLCLWKYPSMAKIKEFTGHTARVLHLASSPNGEQIVSAAADETLRFWKVFAPMKSKKNTSRSRRGQQGLHSNGSRTALRGMNIR